MKQRTFRNTIAFLIVVLVLSVFVALSHAQTAEEMLKNPELTDQERNAIAKAISKQVTNSFPDTLEGMLQWKDMGEAFATTIKTVCRTLNVEVNEFLKSDVGKLVAAVIIYKMVGKDILTIVLYTGIWIGVTFFMIISIKYLHMKKLVDGTIDKDGETIHTKVAIERFSWADDDNNIAKTASLIIHLLLWFAFSCIMAGNVI